MLLMRETVASSSSISSIHLARHLHPFVEIKVFYGGNGDTAISPRHPVNCGNDLLRVDATIGGLTTSTL